MRLLPCLLPALLFTFAAVGGPQAARAQTSETLGETLEEVGEDYAELYTQPVVDAVGMGLNGGFFHQSKVGGGLLPGIDIYAGVKAFGVFVPEEDQTLSLTYRTEETVTYRGETYTADVTYEIDDAPTAFGEEEAGTVTGTAVFVDENGNEQTEQRSFETLPGVFNTSTVPLGVPQVGVGVPLIGTHVSVRYLPRIEYQDLGSLQFTGVGVRHEISNYVPLLPFALSAHGFYQTLSIEESGEDGTEDREVVNATAYALGVSASTSAGPLTLYGGLQYENTTADLSYTFNPEEDGDAAPREITLDLTGENTYRALAGVSLGLGPLVLNVDYSQGQRSAVSAGLGLSL